MTKLTFRCKWVTLVFVPFLAAGMQACASRVETKSEATPILSGPPSTTYPMPPVGGSRALAQMGWVLPEGRHVTVSTYLNKVLVLDFYATWCVPCRDSIPHLIDLQKRYGPEGLAIVGLNVGGPQDQAAIPAFAREFKIDYPLGLPDEALGNLLLSDSDAIPQTFVFDRRGQLVKRYVGYGDSTATQLEATIRAALTPSAD